MFANSIFHDETRHCIFFIAPITTKQAHWAFLTYSHNSLYLVQLLPYKNVQEPLRFRFFCSCLSAFFSHSFSLDIWMVLTFFGIHETHICSEYIYLNSEQGHSDRPNERKKLFTKHFHISHNHHQVATVTVILTYFHLSDKCYLIWALVACKKRHLELLLVSLKKCVDIHKLSSTFAFTLTTSHH